MDQRLKTAAQQGDINTLYSLIQEDPKILKSIDEIPFVDTPLHLAAAAGKIHFALEMMRLMPSFARKLNQDGFSSIHVALQKKDNTKLVLRLVHVDPDLIRVKGREGITPLHYVAEKGHLHMLAEFLSVCPESIEDLTIRSETAMLIAVKNIQFGAFEVLLGWLDRGFYKEVSDLKNKVLNWNDDQGNTLLHIAVSSNQPKVAMLLIKHKVDVNARNLDGFTALDILERQRHLDNKKIKDMLCYAVAKRASVLPKSINLAAYLRSERQLFERFLMRSGKSFMPNENRSAILVVAVLIATATYQAGLNPPGGLRLVPQPKFNSSSNGSTNSGPHLEPLMGFHYYYLFQGTNTIAFGASMGAIFLLFPDSIGVLLLECSLIACYMFPVTYISRQFVYIFSLLLFYSVGMLFVLLTRNRLRLRFFKRVIDPVSTEQWRHQPRQKERMLIIFCLLTISLTIFFVLFWMWASNDK